MNFENGVQLGKLQQLTDEIAGSSQLDRALFEKFRERENFRLTVFVPGDQRYLGRSIPDVFCTCSMVRLMPFAKSRRSQCREDCSRRRTIPFVRSESHCYCRPRRTSLKESLSHLSVALPA